MRNLIIILLLFSGAVKAQTVYTIKPATDTAAVKAQAAKDSIVKMLVDSIGVIDSTLKVKADTAIVLPKVVTLGGLNVRYTRAQIDSILAIRSTYNTATYGRADSIRNRMGTKMDTARFFSVIAGYPTLSQANSLYQSKGAYLLPADTNYLHSLATGKLDATVAANSYQPKGSYLVPTDTLYSSNQTAQSKAAIAGNTAAITVANNTMALKLNTADTMAMLNNYARKAMVLKYTDTVGNYALYKGNTGSPGAQGVQGVQGIQGNPGNNATATDTTSLSNRINNNAANVYSKSASDTRYLQSFTEADPVYSAGITNYYNKSQADARYVQPSGLTPYRLLTDTGRSNTTVTTGYDLNKVKDSLAGLILNATTFSDSTSIVGDSAVFFMTTNKLSTGTALYTAKPVVMATVNDENSTYAFRWTVSPDFKRLVIRGRKASNASNLGVNFLGPLTTIPAGTIIQVIVK